MRLISTSADCILQLAFQPESAALTILGERNELPGVAVLPAAISNGPLSVEPLPFANGGVLAPNGRLLAGQSPKGRLCCWDPMTEEDWSLQQLRFEPMGIAFSSNSRCLFAFGNDSLGRTRVMRCAVDGPETATFATIPQWQKIIAPQSAGESVALYDYVRQLTLLDFADVEHPATWPLDLTIHEMKFSPDGNTLACIAANHVALWSVEGRQQTFALIGHSGLVTSVAFSADGQRLFTGSHDRTVKLWDLRTGRLVRTYVWPIGPVLAVATSPDGLTAAAGDNAGQVVVWDLDAE